MADTIIDGGTAFSSYGATTDGGTAGGGGVTTLLPYQLSYNGLTFGANTGIEITSITGLREAPPTRGSDISRPRQHGSFAGLTLFAERIVTLQLEVWATATTTFEQQLAQLASAFANIADPAAQLPLLFNLSWATARQVVGRPTKGGIPIDVDYQYGRAAVPIEFTCNDPLIYDTATQSPSAGLPSPTAGLHFPVTFDAAFGASSGGSFQVVNGGNEACPPVFVFTGPLTWPVLTMGGYTLGFQIALGATDTLVVDCGARTAILNGTASRGNTRMTGSSWFFIPPGGGSIGFSSVDSTQVAGTVAARELPVAAWGWC